MQHPRSMAVSSSPFRAGPRVRRGLRLWFRTPPRQHGEVDYDREVTFLELFYDLVYVAVIGRAAHHLGAHLSGSTLVGFAAVFALVWFAWFNGSVWHELHGREDGTSRFYIFAQMGLIATLAVFAEGAAGPQARPFTIVYTLVLAQLTWQWWVVHRADQDSRFKKTSGTYLAMLVGAMVAMIISGYVSDGVRVFMWVGMLTVMLVGGFGFLTRGRTKSYDDELSASLVERYGLFTIVVLGEVVVGVVTGLSEAPDLNLHTLIVGVLCMVIGMGFWWSYFDTLGRRIPRASGLRLSLWLFIHLPITLGIAATGAAMVTLIEGAELPRTPAVTAWALAGSASLAVVGISLAAQALGVGEFPPKFRRQVLPTYSTAAAIMLIAGALRPSALTLVIIISAALFLGWLWLFMVFISTGGDFPVLQQANEDLARRKQPPAQIADDQADAESSPVTGAADA